MAAQATSAQPAPPTDGAPPTTAASRAGKDASATTATPAERFELITRRLQETLGGDAIRAILEQGRHPKCYWGGCFCLPRQGLVADCGPLPCAACPMVFSLGFTFVVTSYGRVDVC